MMDEDEEKGSSLKDKASNAMHKASNAKDTTKKAMDMAKKIGKKAGKSGGKAFAKVGSAASKLGPALPYVLLAIVILIVLIGILGFFMTMPGLMTGKLKEFAQGIADWWESLYLGKANATTNEDDIVKSANYIKSMGYDLIGYGFIPAQVVNASSHGLQVDDSGHLVEEVGTDSGYYYDKYGIKYSTGGDEKGASGTYEVAGDINGFMDNVTDVSILRTYIMSDRRLFTIRNFDSGDPILTFIHNYFVKTNARWANGLISLYKTTEMTTVDGEEVEGNSYSYIAKSRYKKVEAGSIKVNSENKTMTVKKGWFNNEMVYKMDGWSGRYGLSQEFLLSLHLATLAPELVTTMARSFDTEVQVYLGTVTGATVDSYFYNGESYLERSEIFDGYGLYITKKEAKKIMQDNNITSQKEGYFACTHVLQPEVLRVNGSSTDKEYNELTTKHENYAKDIVKGKGDTGRDQYDGDENWERCFTEKDGELVTRDDMIGTSGDDIWDIQDWINQSIGYVKDNYPNYIWIDVDDGNKEKKASEFPYTYYISKVDGYAQYFKEIDDWDRYYGHGYPRRGFDSFMTFQDVIHTDGGYDNGGGLEFEICTFSENPDDPENSHEIVVSVLVYFTSVDHNWDMMVMVYKDLTPKERAAGVEDVCSNHFDESNFTKVCSSCRKYVAMIKKSLNKVHDSNFKTYIPYIARVIDSWFRDTYFVIPTDEEAKGDEAIKDAYSNKSFITYNFGHGDKYGNDKIKLSGDDIKLIKVDDEYLKDTGEYWTQYEVDEHTGEYILYELKEDGTLGDKWPGTEEEAEEKGIKLSKKAITRNSSELMAGGSSGDFNGWTAYNIAEMDSNEKIPLNVDEKTARPIKLVSNYDSSSGKYDERIYYSMSKMPKVEQTEDGQRGVTNPLIKKMFKIRKYYIYDGTSERAEAIYNDWQRVINEHMPASFSLQTTKYCVFVPGTLVPIYWDSYTNPEERIQVENELELAIDDYYYGTSTSKIHLDRDPRDPGLIGNITINKDTLAAFGILENTHTLDSDYAYRDFKELIVELNYFDKEDLSEDPDDVFDWIYPELGYGNWPNRFFDKSEEMYGTLLHSKKMYDLLMEIEGKKQVENTNDQDEEGTTPAAPTTPTTPTTPATTESETPSTPSVSSDYLTQLEENARKIEKHCGDNSYSYNAGLPGNSEDIRSLWDKRGVSCCAGALWVLAETSDELATFINDMINKPNTNAGESFCNFRSSYSTLDYFQIYSNFPIEQVSSQSQLQPGDLVIWDNHHTQLYLGDNWWFNSGGSSPVVSVSQWDAVSHFYGSWGVYPYAIHVTGTANGGGSGASAPPFEGYATGTEVVSPVTGRIESIQYKKVEMETEEIDGQKTVYNVDYIKIKPLSEYDIELLKGSTLESNTHEYEYNDNKYTRTDYDAYKEFCKDYEGVCDDYVITIKGLNCLTEEQIKSFAGVDVTNEANNKISVTIEGPEIARNVTVTVDENTGDKKETENAGGTPPTTDEEGIIGTSKDFTINNYVKRETPNLVEDKKEEEFSAKEDAKFDAQCVVTIFDPELGKDVTYIKAGTVIGYTTEANMKLILRDNKNAVKENIEDYFYFPLTEEGNKEGVYGDLETITESSTLEEKVRAAVTYYRSQGYTTEAACGIVGNLYCETGLDPTVGAGAGYSGIAQWDRTQVYEPKVLPWVRSKGYNDTDFAGQIRAIVEGEEVIRQALDMGGIYATKWKEELPTLTNPRQAAELFAVLYERCVYVAAYADRCDPVEYYTFASSAYQDLNKRKNAADWAMKVYLNQEGAVAP